MKASHLLLAIAIALVWGFNWVVITVCLEDVPPIFLAFIRFFLISMPAVFFVKAPKAPLTLIAAYGIAMFATQFSLLFIGMYIGVPPGLASLIIQVQIFFSLLFAVLFFEEKLHIWQGLGAIVSFSGIGIIGLNVSGTVNLLGILLVLGAAVCYSLGSVFSKKIGDVNMIALVIWGSFFAWPPLLVATLSFEGIDKIKYSLEHITWIAAGGIAYIIFASTLFAFGAWSYLVHHHRLSIIAPFSLLTPIVAILASVLILGEEFDLWKLTAGTLIIIGLAINYLGPLLWKPRKE